MKSIDQLIEGWKAYYKERHYCLEQQIACTKDEIAFGPRSPDANHTVAAELLLSQLQEQRPKPNALAPIQAAINEYIRNHNSLAHGTTMKKIKAINLDIVYELGDNEPHYF